MKTTIEEIERLIGENQLKSATQKLQQLAKKTGDEDLNDSALLTLSRLNNFLTKSSQGMVEDFDVEFNKITLSIITLKNSVKKALDSTKTVDSTTNKNEATEQLIFEEHFKNNKNGWLVGENEDSKVEIKNGRYFIDRIRSKKATYSSKTIKINEKKNFRIISRTTFLKGDMDTGYGMTWGGSDSGYTFGFIITVDGSYKIYYFIENKQIILCDWTKNPVIKQGKNTNTLEVIKHNNILHFKINGEVVFTTDFISFFGDRIGITTSSEIKIAVDYFAIFN